MPTSDQPGNSAGMNPFLACFLACALVQLIAIVAVFQYAAYKNRKDEDEAAATAATAAERHAAFMKEHERQMDALDADHRRRMAEIEERRRARFEKIDRCPMCGKHREPAAEPGDVVQAKS